MAYSFKKYRLPQVLTEPELYRIAEFYGCSTGPAKGIGPLFWMILSVLFVMSCLGVFFETWDGNWDNGYYILIILFIISMGIFVLSLRVFLEKRKRKHQIQADLADGHVFLKKTKIIDIKIDYDSEGTDTRKTYLSDGSCWMDVPYSMHAYDHKQKAEPGMICYLLCVDKNDVFMFLENDMAISGEVQARVIDLTGTTGKAQNDEMKEAEEQP